MGNPTHPTKKMNAPTARQRLHNGKKFRAKTHVHNQNHVNRMMPKKRNGNKSMMGTEAKQHFTLKDGRKAPGGMIGRRNKTRFPAVLVRRKLKTVSFPTILRKRIGTIDARWVCMRDTGGRSTNENRKRSGR